MISLAALRLNVTAKIIDGIATPVLTKLAIRFFTVVQDEIDNLLEANNKPFLDDVNYSVEDLVDPLLKEIPKNFTWEYTTYMGDEYFFIFVIKPNIIEDVLCNQHEVPSFKPLIDWMNSIGITPENDKPKLCTIIDYS